MTASAYTFWISMEQIAAQIKIQFRSNSQSSSQQWRRDVITQAGSWYDVTDDEQISTNKIAFH